MITLSYLTVDGAGPLEHVEAAAAGGFDGADLRILAPTHLPIRRRVVGNARLINELKLVCRRTGMRILNVESIALRPDVDVASFAATLATAAELGARNILTLIEDMEPQQAIDTFGAFCMSASSHGLRAAIEFMPFRAVKTLDQAVALVDCVGTDKAGVLIDTLHLHWTGGGVEDLARLPAGHIAYVQICDAPIRIPPPEQQIQIARHGRLYPGKGELPLMDLLDVLPADIPISVEIPYRAHARRSVIERASMAGTATRHFFAEMAARSPLPVAVG